MTHKFHAAALALTTSALLTLTCASALAANPTLTATISGELRSFSPDGRYAAVLDRTIEALYDTSNWKLLGDTVMESQ